MSVARRATNRVYQLVEEGYLDRDFLISACLSYLSEADVVEMAHKNEIPLEEEPGEDLYED